MPLFLAEFSEAAPVLLDAATAVHACEMLTAHDCPDPVKLHEVPPGTFLAELFEEDDELDADTPNPANLSRTGYAFEPLDATVEWLNLLTPTLGQAPTEAPPESEDRPDGEAP